MHSLIIRNPSSPSLFFFMELIIQCKLARRAYSSLSAYARAEVDEDCDFKLSRTMGAIEVISECIVFLSAAKVIAKILFPGTSSPSKSKLRAAELRTKLCISELPNLSSLSVRNSFEHIDERLDGILRDYREHSICQVHVSLEEPASSLVLRRFDPRALTISFLGETLNLKPCNQEILELEQLIPKAIAR
jgi:hypothetical protein